MCGPLALPREPAASGLPRAPSWLVGCCVPRQGQAPALGWSRPSWGVPGLPTLQRGRAPADLSLCPTEPLGEDEADGPGDGGEATADEDRLDSLEAPEAAEGESLPCRAVLCCTLPCRSVLCCAVLCRAMPCHAMPCCDVPCLAAVLSPRAVGVVGGSEAQGAGAAVPMEGVMCRAVPCPAPCLCGCAMACVRLRRSCSVPRRPCLHLVTRFPSADVGPRQKPASSPHGETLTGTEAGADGDGARPWGAVGQRRHLLGTDGDGDADGGVHTSGPPRPSLSSCLQGPGWGSQGPHRAVLRPVSCTGQH